MAQKRELELLKLDAMDTGDGVKTRSDMRESAIMGGMQTMLERFAANANAPKRVIRDENGDVVGVESVVN